MGVPDTAFDIFCLIAPFLYLFSLESLRRLTRQPVRSCRRRRRDGRRSRSFKRSIAVIRGASGHRARKTSRCGRQACRSSAVPAPLASLVPIAPLPPPPPQGAQEGADARRNMLHRDILRPASGVQGLQAVEGAALPSPCFPQRSPVIARRIIDMRKKSTNSRRRISERKHVTFYAETETQPE